MAEAMRFKIGSKVYDTNRVDDLSLRDIMLFNSQAEAMGLPERWHDIERITGEIAEMGKKADTHPDAMVMFGVTVWACRRLEGENLSLDEATNVPISQIEVLASPKDRQPSKRKPPQKRKPQPKRSPRKATPAAAEPPVVEDL